MAGTSGRNKRLSIFAATAAVTGAAGDVLDFVKRHALLGQRLESVFFESIAYAHEHGRKFTAMRIIVNTFSEFFLR